MIKETRLKDKREKDRDRRVDDKTQKEKGHAEKWNLCGIGASEWLVWGKARNWDRLEEMKYWKLRVIVCPRRKQKSFGAGGCSLVRLGADCAWRGVLHQHMATGTVQRAFCRRLWTVLGGTIRFAVGRPELKERAIQEREKKERRKERCEYTTSKQKQWTERKERTACEAKQDKKRERGKEEEHRRGNSVSLDKEGAMELWWVRQDMVRQKKLTMRDCTRRAARVMDGGG